ncbi:MAG: signal transduction histidine kinase [Bacteroidia bacterium]|jgi:signal transduction histidine kinase
MTYLIEIEKMRKMRSIKCLLAFLLLLLSLPSFAQNKDGEQLLKEAYNFFSNQKIEKALPLALKANSFYDSLGKTESLAETNVLLGKLYQAQKRYGPALLYFLQAENYYQQAKNQKALFELNKQLASMYAEWGVEKRAASYWAKSASIASSEEEKLDLIKESAQAFDKGSQLDSALLYYNILSDAYSKQANGYEKEIEILHSMIALYNRLGQDSLATILNKKAIKISSDNQDWENMALAYNNLGFLQKKTNKNKEAFESFAQGLKLLEEKNVGKKYEINYLVNLGVISQNLKNYNEAFDYLERAKELLKTEDKHIELARVENILAKMRLSIKDYYQAKLHNASALVLAISPDAYKERLDAYKTGYLIHKELRNYKDALEKFQKYVELEDSIQTIERVSDSALKEKEDIINNANQNLSLLLIEKEIKQMELKQTELEEEKRGQAYDILLKEKALENAALKQEEARNSAALQGVLLKQQQKEVETNKLLLENLKTANELTLKQKELEDAKSKQALEVLENEREIQKLEIEKQALEGKEAKRREQLTIYGVCALLFILVIIIWLLIKSFRATKKLREQKTVIVEQSDKMHEANDQLQHNAEEMAAQNEELRQQSEELMITNESLGLTSQQLEKSMGAVKDAQMQLVQAEKMSSLGQLTAGIAHEINNPINFVYAGADTLKMLINDVSELLIKYDDITPDDSKERLIEKLQEIEEFKNGIDYHELDDDIKGLIADIINGAERTQAIVKSLKTFSRHGEEDIKYADLHENIESTLVILRSKMGSRVTLIKDYDEFLPTVNCNAGQINQVFMNLIGNANQAIEGKGTITISTRYDKDTNKVHLIFSDTGSGMPKEVQQRIFEPFFTTKDVGKGTGLGLSISHGIIEKHQGTITVESEMGKGTTFHIMLPKDGISQS